MGARRAVRKRRTSGVPLASVSADPSPHGSVGVTAEVGEPSGVGWPNVPVAPAPTRTRESRARFVRWLTVLAGAILSACAAQIVCVILGREDLMDTIGPLFAWTIGVYLLASAAIAFLRFVVGAIRGMDRGPCRTCGLTVYGTDAVCRFCGAVQDVREATGPDRYRE